MDWLDLFSPPGENFVWEVLVRDFPHQYYILLMALAVGVFFGGFLPGETGLAVPLVFLSVLPLFGGLILLSTLGVLRNLHNPVTAMDTLLLPISNREYVDAFQRLLWFVVSSALVFGAVAGLVPFVLNFVTLLENPWVTVRIFAVSVVQSVLFWRMAYWYYIICRSILRVLMLTLVLSFVSGFALVMVMTYTHSAHNGLFFAVVHCVLYWSIGSFCLRRCRCGFVEEACAKVFP